VTLVFSWMAAANAAELSAQATQQGMEGVVSLGSQVASMAPLFAKTAAVKQLGAAEQYASRQGMSAEQLQSDISKMGTVGGVDFSKVAGMSRMQYQDFMSKLDPKIIRQIGTEQVGLWSQRNKAAQGMKNISPSSFNLYDGLDFAPF
jgi:hypothetical protein